MRALVCLLGSLLFVSPIQAAPVTFSSALFAKFQHQRCLNCHQFNSRRSNGRAYHSHRSRYLCESCHLPQLTGLQGGEWMAPPGERMDYTGMDARAACALITRNSRASGPEGLVRHLLQDGRVLWAVRSGMTPAGPQDVVPGGVEAWQRDVRAWAADGLICE